MRPPTWAIWAGLLLAVTMCASASIVLSILTNSWGVSSALIVSWRLAWVELLTAIPFLLTVRSQLHEHGVSNRLLRASSSAEISEVLLSVDEDETLAQRYWTALPLLALSGVCLSFHFIAWVESLQRTSLAHSLLWVSMGPIILNAGSWLIFLIYPGGFTRPTGLETVGAVAGIAGCLILLCDTTTSMANDSNSTTTATLAIEPSWQGDMIALGGAAAVSLYLVIGRYLRRWMPLWIYSFVVVGCAYITSLGFAIVSTPDLTIGQIFGFLQTPYLLFALYLGVGPGIAGHTLFNGLLKYVSPLLISTAMLAEPVVGSIMGYFFGMQDVPGLFTCLGGGVLLVGLFLVLAGENQRSQETTDSDADGEKLLLLPETMTHGTT